MIIICDLDGTLANIDHRRPMVEGVKKPDWDTFFAKMIEDEVNAWCAELLERMGGGPLRRMNHGGHKIFLVTGRPERYRLQTVMWLQYHSIGYDKLLMRKDDDHRPDYVIKEEIFKESFDDEQRKEILFVLDDRKQVVDMWRRNGLTVLQCAEGDF